MKVERFKRLDYEVGLRMDAQFLRRKSGSNGHAFHPGTLGCLNPHERVLDDDAVGGYKAQLMGGFFKDFGMRLGLRDLVSGQDNVEIGA